MAQPKRYFLNLIPNYSGGEVKIPKDSIKERCVNFLQTIFDKQRVTEESYEGGLYVGLAGIAYTCYYLAKQPIFEKDKSQLLDRAEKYISHAMSYYNNPNMRSDPSDKPSFLLGAGGVYALAAAVSHIQGKNREKEHFLGQYASLADICLPKNFLKCGSDELFVGRAGYLCGVLFLQRNIGAPVLSSQKIAALCQTIIACGRDYSRSVNSPCPLMYAYYTTEYLGAAHGLSSILQILLSFPDYLDANPENEKYVKDSVDFMLRLQTPTGNFPCAMDKVHRNRPESEDLVHWCHGAPGVVYLMAKAYLRWKDEKYLQSCLLCGEIVWKKGLLRKGPGICHGVAGSGYVFLLLYRLTSDPLHLYRALQFANFLFTDDFKREARTPDSPYSLYEGLAGTVCFLSDLLCPQNASFPFFDVM